MAGPTGNVADTFFGTGPDDLLAVVDVYGTPAATPANGQPATPALTSNALITAANPSTPNTLLTPTGVTTTPTSASAAANTISKVTGLSTGALQSIGDKLKNALLNAAGVAALGSGVPAAFKANGLPGALQQAGPILSKIPGVKMVYDGVVQTIDSVDLATAEGISDFMNTFNGADISSVFNLKSKMDVLGTLLQSATGLKIPGVLDDIINQFDQSDIPNFLSGQILGALENASLELLSKIISHIPHASDVILAIVPNAIQILLQNYKLPVGATFPTNQNADALIDILNAIDPNWASYNRNGVTIRKLDPFVHASDHALSVLELRSEYIEAALIAREYVPTTIIENANRCFPKAVIQSRLPSQNAAPSITANTVVKMLPGLQNTISKAILDL